MQLHGNPDLAHRAEQEYADEQKMKNVDERTEYMGIHKKLQLQLLSWYFVHILGYDRVLCDEHGSELVNKLGVQSPECGCEWQVLSGIYDDTVVGGYVSTGIFQKGLNFVRNMSSHMTSEQIQEFLNTIKLGEEDAEV